MANGTTSIRSSVSVGRTISTRRCCQGVMTTSRFAFCPSNRPPGNQALLPRFAHLTRSWPSTATIASTAERSSAGRRACDSLVAFAMAGARAGARRKAIVSVARSGAIAFRQTIGRVGEPRRLPSCGRAIVAPGSARRMSGDDESEELQPVRRKTSHCFAPIPLTGSSDPPRSFRVQASAVGAVPSVPGTRPQ